MYIFKKQISSDSIVLGTIRKLLNNDIQKKQILNTIFCRFVDNKYAVWSSFVKLNSITGKY